MTKWLRAEYSEFVWWLALVAVAVVLFLITIGTWLHQFALGLLISSITLLIVLTLFEFAWQKVASATGQQGVDGRTHSRGGPRSPSQ
jgi:hypothetical protein